MATLFMWGNALIMHCVLKKNPCYLYNYNKMVEFTSLIGEDSDEDTEIDVSET